jgi:hypothetical protein
VGEQWILVCDVCGSPAEQTVNFSVGARRLAQDLCGTHLQELVRRSHTPRRGGNRRSAAQLKPASGEPRRTRARQKAKSRARKAPRKRITDPAALEKRRASLAKARQALARKRAVQKKTS